MKPLPMPLRLAAGLVATAIEEAQELPRKLIELPVTAVSQVLQASMRMQQRVTELAIKGDQALGGLRPVPETPTWARFDEDDTESPFGGGPFSGGSGGGSGGPFGGGPFGGGTEHPFGGGDRSYGGGNGVAGGHSDTDWNVPPPRSSHRTVSPIRVARDPEPTEDLHAQEASGGPTESDPPGSGSGPSAATKQAVTEPAAAKPTAAKPATSKPATSKAAASKAAASKPATSKAAVSKAAVSKAAVSETATSKAAASKAAASKAAVSETATSKGATSKPAAKPSAGKGPSSKAAAKPSTPAKSSTPAKAENGPKGHEDYPTWTLPQLRGRFRSLELSDVKALLSWETSHLDRPPYVTMLSNRIASITGR